MLSEKDAVISDELNHASIIDGIRLCKASRYRYKNNDMNDLEDKLKEASHARFKLIATDGVFSMDGTLADLEGICALLRQRSRPYLFSNSLAPMIVGVTIQVLDLLSSTTYYRDKLEKNTMGFCGERTNKPLLMGTGPRDMLLLHDRRGFRWCVLDLLDILQYRLHLKL